MKPAPLIVAIVGAVSNLKVENNEVNAIGYNTQLNNNNYTTLAYTGNLFENNVYVLTTDTTTTLQDLWDYELSSGFVGYLSTNGYPYDSYLNTYVSGNVVSTSSIVSSFGVGTHTIYYRYKTTTSSFENSPTSTFEVVEPAPVCSPSLTGDLSITSYSQDYPNDTSVIANITDDLIYNIRPNLSNVVYTASNCATTNNPSVSITISPTITFGNHSYTATFTYNGVSFSKTINFNWYYTAPPVCSPSLTGDLFVISYSNDEPYSINVVANITDDLIYDIGLNLTNVVYTNSSCATSNVSPTISISPTITFGNNSYTATFTYSGVSFTKTINFNWYNSIPVISGINYYETDNKTQISLSTIFSNLTVSDDIDTGLIPVLQSDNYSASWEIPGNYTIIYQVVDSDNNSSTYTIRIEVSEWLAPITIATGLPEALTINASLGNGQPLTFVAFCDYLGSHYEIPQGVSISITPETNPIFGVNTYLVNGQYTLILSYIDDIPPVITREQGQLVQVGTSDNDVLVNIKNSLIVSDNYSSLTINNITIDSDNYTSHKNTPGSYDVVFKVYDDFNNYCSYTITINVVDNTPPVITGTLIYNSLVSEPISVDEIISGLSAIDNVDGDVSSFIVVKTDNYSENKDKVGTYYVVFKVEDSLFNKSEISVRINVVDNSTSTSITGFLGFVKKLIDFIINIFKSIFGL